MNSTLLDGSCEGACVAFCIAGTTRTFWDVSVLQSNRDVLFDGFGVKRRNDIYLLLNDVDGGRKRDLDAPMPFSLEQFPQLRRFLMPVAHILVASFEVKGNAHFKIRRCLTEIRSTETQIGRRYDWFVRSRPDLLWKRMSLNTMTAGLPQVVRYRDDQFSIWPRALLAATRDNPGCVSAAPTNKTNAPLALDRDVIVVGSPACSVPTRQEYFTYFEYRLWRTNSALGRKERYFHTILCTIMIAYLTELSRLEQLQPSRAGFAELLTVNFCLRNVAAMLCSRYVNDLLKSDIRAELRRIREPHNGILANLVELLNRSRYAAHAVDPRTTRHTLALARQVLWNQMSQPNEIRMPALDEACRGYWWRHLNKKLKLSHMYVSAKPDMPGLYPGQYGECATT